MNDLMGMRPPTMCTIQSSSDSYTERAHRALRIEPVDHWHEAWDGVLEAVRSQGSIRRLRIDADGWLSARQVLMVAFVGDEPAAHLCFSVNPSRSGRIEARLASHGIDPAYTDRGIESQLHQAAVEWAQSLRCQTLRGFQLASQWC
jgi:GNAT superfamily N-acetyltransferase